MNAPVTNSASRPASVLLALVAAGLCSCQSVDKEQGQFSYFTDFKNLTKFTRQLNESRQTILYSPEIKSRIKWNQLVVSWNANAPEGTFLKVEAAAISNGHQTRFYAMENWSPDNKSLQRSSMSGQKDADGSVDTDTLILTGLADAAQIRLTLGGTNGQQPTLKFLGVSFANTTVPTIVRPPNHAAWGKVITTPERSQHGYPNEKGWCSPTSMSMVLARWSEVLHRPEMNLTVPQVAEAVYDSDFDGTGNWPFNTAFAGSFTGMRSYVTRFDDLTEVEDWIAAGIPVILSGRWDWLKPGRPADSVGHLFVCIGFTEDGDVVVNDPATRLERGQSVRHIYKREDVLHSWSKSHHAVYLVYPVGSKIPPNRYRHWEG